MTGSIFNIQHFSTFDGPGIRTTVFFKGCNLRCIWCHNPESFDREVQLQFFGDRCVSCGRCFKACKKGYHYIDEDSGRHVISDSCDRCGACVSICYANALTMVGREINEQELIRLILKDRLYFKNSNGGVTFSGGECMLQTDFLQSVSEKLKLEGVHLAIDTAGNVPYNLFEQVNPYIDLYLYDLKAADTDVHKQLTGVGNERIIENLQRLTNDNKEVIVRIPYVPGYNDHQMDGIMEILRPLPIKRAQILPYHKLGEGKKESLQIKIEHSFIEPSNKELEAVCDRYNRYGINCIYNKIK